MNICNIQDGGRPPYWQSFLAIIQQPIAGFQWNFARESSFLYRMLVMGQLPALHNVFLCSWCIFGRRLCCRLWYTCYSSNYTEQWTEGRTDGRLCWDCLQYICLMQQVSSLCFPLRPLGHISDVILVCKKGNIEKKTCLCITVLCTIMMHNGTSSSYRSVDCIGLESWFSSLSSKRLCDLDCILLFIF